MKLSNFDISEEDSKFLFYISIAIIATFFLIDSEGLQKTWWFNGHEVIDNCENYGHIKIWNYCGDHINVKDSYIKEEMIANLHDGDSFFANLSVLFLSDLLSLYLLHASIVGMILLRKEKNAKLFFFIFFIMIGSIIVVDTFIPVGNDNEEYRMIIFLIFIAISTSYTITKLETLYKIIKK